MRPDPDRTPVIIGVGQINDRPSPPEEGLDPVALMEQALRLADADAGGLWLAKCDSLAVVSQLAWPQLNPVAEKLATRLAMTPRLCSQTAKPNGDSPVRLLHDAANLIGSGEASLCAVVGAEALRTASALAAATAPARLPTRVDALRDAPHRVRKGYAQSYGLVVPTDVYPLYENAGRSAYGQTLEEGQAESGTMWAGMAQIAASNSAAWIRTPSTAEAIVTPGDGNRPIAFPYTKLQAANASVNQGAGFLVASLSAARARGIHEERLVYIGHGAAAREDEDFLLRDGFAASPSLSVVLEQTLARNGVSTDDLDLVELYSCFPCVPKMARRVLGWPLARPISVVGGLTFAGGPIGNYMSHAIAGMTECLRGTSQRGLLFANGGYATHNHALMLSGAPLAAEFPQDYDAQGLADQRRLPIPRLDELYIGPAVIETYTVFYDRVGQVRSGVVVARTPQGTRTLAHVPPEGRAILSLLTSTENDPVGRAGRVVSGPEALQLWSMD